MGPRLSCWSSSPVDRCPKIAGVREELESCPDKRPHIPHSQSLGKLPDYTCAERLLEVEKGRGHHAIAADVNPPIGLFTRLHLG